MIPSVKARILTTVIPIMVRIWWSHTGVAISSNPSRMETRFMKRFAEVSFKITFFRGT